MSEFRSRPDVVETFHGATIQHGELNERVYLMSLGDASAAELPGQLIEAARDRGYTKIFAKIPARAYDPFLAAGFRVEADVPGFYRGEEPALFLGYYLSDARRVESDAESLDSVLHLAEEKRDAAESASTPPDDRRVTARLCTRDDLGRMAEIYRDVFPSYPFPIHDPAYLETTMNSHVDYFCIEANGMLVALSSAEKDVENLNAEMTDFATLPDWRGHGLATHLLAKMEIHAAGEGIRTAYTIARAVSPGMNITFARRGYLYGGRLVNNTNISGRIESMNVWYKPLAG